MTDYLFSERDLHNLLENHKNTLRKEVLEIDQQSFADTNEADLREHLLEKYRIDPPKILSDKIYVGQPTEVDIDVTRDPRYDLGRSVGRSSVKGTRVVIHVPFEGEAEFFKWQPSRYTLSPPRGEIHENEIHLVYDVHGSDSGNLKERYQRDVASIEEYLKTVHSQVERCLAEVPSVIDSAVSARKQRLQYGKGLIEDLALPAAQPSRQGATIEKSPESQPTRPPQSTRAQRIHDAFIAHASEDKDFVTPLANALVELGLDIWYDEFTLRVGDSLRQSIDRGLARSRFGVVVLSHAFFEKQWPQYELNGLVAREVKGKKVILPVWRDLTHDEVLEYSPPIADKFALSYPKSEIEEIARELSLVMQESGE